MNGRGCEGEPSLVGGVVLSRGYRPLNGVP